MKENIRFNENDDWPTVCSKLNKLVESYPVTFDNPKTFVDGTIQKSFNFKPSDLEPLPNPIPKKTELQHEVEYDKKQTEKWVPAEPLKISRYWWVVWGIKAWFNKKYWTIMDRIKYPGYRLVKDGEISPPGKSLVMDLKTGRNYVKIDNPKEPSNERK